MMPVSRTPAAFSIRRRNWRVHSRHGSTHHLERVADVLRVGKSKRPRFAATGEHAGNDEIECHIIGPIDEAARAAGHGLNIGGAYQPYESVESL